jgi:hypothetical protein
VLILKAELFLWTTAVVVVVVDRWWTDIMTPDSHCTPDRGEVNAKALG